MPAVYRVGTWNVTPPKAAAYTATVGEMVQVDPSAGTVAITLPTAVGVPGKSIKVKDATGAAATHTITVGVTSFTAVQTIDGASTSTLTTNYQAKTFVSDGANWFTS